MRCCDCGTTDSGMVYLNYHGAMVCENCWQRGSY